MFWRSYTMIAGGPVFVILLLGLGLHYNLFHSTSWYDLFMHVLGGGAAATSLAGMAWHMKRFSDRHLIALMSLRGVLIAAVLGISILWEIAEVIFGMTPNMTQSVGDTVLDVCCALVGAVSVLFFIQPSAD